MALDRNAVIKDAQKFAGKGQYDKAIAEWKKLVKESPNDANIYNTIGDLSLKKNAKADAVDAYKKAADILASDGFTSKAIALYKKILNIDPKRVDVHIALGDLNAEKGLTGNALEGYKQAADYYVAKNEMAKALGIYQKMADLNPANAGFRTKLGDMYAKEGLKGEAAKAYLEAAEVHIGNNAFQEARQIFEKVLAVDPHNKKVYHKAGVVYFKEEKYAEACKALKPAFDADPQNQELALAYVDALTKAGRAAEAVEALTKLIAAEPGRLELHERLYQIHLAEKDEGKALDAAGKIVDIHVDNRDFDTAETALRSFVNACPKSAEGRRKLAEFLLNTRREEDGAKELIAAADLFIAAGNRDAARDALTRAVDIAPQLSEASRKLQSLEGGEAPAAQAAPVAEEAPEAITIPEPGAAEPAFTEPEPSFGEALSAPAPAAEEDPAVTEAFTEIEVLIKYGLAAKALEQLEGLAAKHPSSVAVRAKLRDLYQEQGNVPKAVQHVIALADLYAASGQGDRAASVLREALAFAPGDRDIMARLGAEAGQAAPALSLETGEAPAFGEISFEGAAGGAVPSLEQEMLTSEEVPALGSGPSFGEISLEQQAAGESVEESLAVEWTPPVVEPAGAGIPTPPPGSALEESLAVPVDISELWAEAEFFFQQGLYDAAKQKYQNILAHAPGDQRARARIAEIARTSEDEQELSKLAEAVEGLESFVPSGAAEAGASVSESDEEAVRSLMREIEMMKRAEAAKAPSQPARSRPSAAPAQPPRESRPAPAAEDADEFFDLAAELREDLGSVSLPARGAASLEEQSLDDIFEEFKAGVEARSSQQDSDTHYNLGIAYKEMGLLDDAIAEFQLTHEGEPMFVQSRYMLGLCFMEKGDFPKAIAEVRNALGYAESFATEAEDILSMHYDLGLAYQGAGNAGEATRQFQAVHAANPGFRDVAAKLNELREGDFVSLDQLKEDIEKEISAKFLEEGERINREEQIRKAVKVKH